MALTNGDWKQIGDAACPLIVLIVVTAIIFFPITMIILGVLAISASLADKRHKAKDKKIAASRKHYQPLKSDNEQTSGRPLSTSDAEFFALPKKAQNQGLKQFFEQKKNRVTLQGYLIK